MAILKKNGYFCPKRSGHPGLNQVVEVSRLSRSSGAQEDVSDIDSCLEKYGSGRQSLVYCFYISNRNSNRVKRSMIEMDKKEDSLKDIMMALMKGKSEKQFENQSENQSFSDMLSHIMSH